MIIAKIGDREKGNKKVHQVSCYRDTDSYHAILDLPEALEQKDRTAVEVALSHSRWSLSLSASLLFQLQA